MKAKAIVTRPFECRDNRAMPLSLGEAKADPKSEGIAARQEPLMEARS